MMGLEGREVGDWMMKLVHGNVELWVIKWVAVTGW